MHTILIIEDEQAIRSMVRFGLRKQPFELLEAADAKQAKQHLSETLPDLILLDWMLPGQSGIDLMRAIKSEQATANIPIIMLTAKAEDDNKVKGLGTGADDYVTKPFSPAELIARIQAVLRRSIVATPDNQVHYADLTLDPIQGIIKIEGQSLALTPNQYQLLAFLMRHPERVYSRQQLMTQVWGPGVFIDERSVDAQIKRLRQVLKASQRDHWIQTVRGLGYKLQADRGDND